jgi:hypothetical protein
MRRSKVTSAFFGSGITLRSESMARPAREIITTAENNTGFSGTTLRRLDIREPAAAVSKNMSK